MRLSDGTNIEEVEELVQNVAKDYPLFVRIERNVILTVTELFPRAVKYYI